MAWCWKTEDGCVSDWRPITSGVTQGSLLVYCLFIIYIQDLEEDVDVINSTFADDAKTAAVARIDAEKIHISIAWTREFELSGRWD